MALPTIAAGWAATKWPLAQVFPWFAAIVALACLAAAAVGATGITSRGRRTRQAS
jgi:hypothetical protein